MKISFTPREKTILPGLKQGLPRKIIASNLEISIFTLDVNLKNIRRKCGVATIKECAIFLQGFRG